MAKQTPRTDESSKAAAIKAVVEAKRSLHAVGKEYGVAPNQVRRWVMAWKIANPPGKPRPSLVERFAHVGAPASEEPVDEGDPPSSPYAGVTKMLVAQSELRGEVAAPMAETDTSTPTDPITIMQGVAQAIQTQIQANKTLGNVEVAAKLTRDLVTVANNLARAIEKSSKADGAIVVTKDEAISIEQDLERRQKAEVGERPILCAHCGKELSILWGTGGNSGEPKE